MADLLIDWDGVTHEPAKTSCRIVSLVPSLTELLFTLGLAERVVGRTSFCVHPAELVAPIPVVGGTKTVSLERVADLRPTHVLVNVDENLRETVDAIRELGASIVVTHPVEPRENLRLYRLFGNLFGAEDTAEELCEEFAEAWRTMQRRTALLSPRNVLYLIWRSPWMTVSESTYISGMLRLVRWQTLGGEPHVRYPEIELEDIAPWAELVLLSSEPYPFKLADIDEVREMVGKSGARVETIDGGLISWYGSRAIRGLEYVTDRALTLDERIGY